MSHSNSSVTPKRPRIVVLFQRLGPYHFARLRAAGAVMDVTAIEFTAMDAVYSWDAITHADGFGRLALFKDENEYRAKDAPVQRVLNEALNRIQPDAVVIPGWSEIGALAALRWCLDARKPAVVMVESVAQYLFRRVWWKEWTKKQVLKMCSSAFVGGQSQAAYLASFNAVPTDRVFPGYDVVDNAHFSAGADRARAQGESLRAKLSLPSTYFFLSARFIEEKNLPRFLQAYARYKELVKRESRNGSAGHWPLVLMGDGPLRAELEGIINGLGLRADVHLPGFKQYQDLPAYYAFAGAFVLPSISDMWGLVINEAMAAGLPILVSDHCGCAPDLVKDGVNGFTFDPENVEQLAQLMLKISAFPPSSLSAFGDASREIVSHWGPERFALGLKQAVDCARAIGPKKFSLVGSTMLTMLMRR